jgi:STE24 endopeptidase
MSEISIDPKRQEQAKRYARINRRLMLVELAIGAVYSLAWLVAGWSANLQAVLSAWTSNAWLQVAAFAAIFGGVYTLINLPLSYYSGFVLPHRFGLSNESATGWATDQLKSLAVSVVLGGILIEVIYAVLRLSPEWWWLWVAGIMLVFTVLLANLAPVLLMPIFYKFVPLGEEHADLVERLLRLAERAHTRVQGVFMFDMSRRTKAANAALTGLGNTRRIILGDTLIEEFTPDEIETVLAHELGHHVHKDIPAGIVLESAMTLVGLYLASDIFRFQQPGRRGSDAAAHPGHGGIRAGDHAAGECLFALARAPRRRLCLAYHRQRQRLRLRTGASCQSKPGGGRPRALGGAPALLASGAGAAHRHGAGFQSRFLTVNGKANPHPITRVRIVVLNSRL